MIFLHFWRKTVGTRRFNCFNCFFRMLYSMATQLADRGPNPDLQSAKVGPRPTIGPTLGSSHFSGRELTVCPTHVQRANPYQIAVKTFFWSSITFWSPYCGEVLFYFFVWPSSRLLVYTSSGPLPNFFNFFWTKRIFICYIRTFAKTSTHAGFSKGPDIF